MKIKNIHANPTRFTPGELYLLYNTSIPDRYIEYLSFGAIGILFSSFSHKNEWEMDLANRGSDLKEVTLDLLNELEENHHLLKISEGNYEMFEEPEDCKRRIQELTKSESLL